MESKLSAQASYQRRRRAAMASVTIFLVPGLKSRVDEDVADLATTQQDWFTAAAAEKLSRRAAPGAAALACVAVLAASLGAAAAVTAGYGPPGAAQVGALARADGEGGAPGGTLLVRVIDARGARLTEERLRPGENGLREFRLSSDTVVPGRLEARRSAYGAETAERTPDVVRVSFGGTLSGGEPSGRLLTYGFTYSRSPAGPEPPAGAAQVSLRGSLLLRKGDIVRLPFTDPSGETATLVISDGGP